MIRVETDRLRLRDWEEADKAPFIAMNQDENVMRYFPALVSAEDSLKLIEKCQENMETHGFTLFAAECKASSEFIGFIGLAPLYISAHDYHGVEIGWRLKHSAWGQGLATEGAKAVLRAGFEDFGLPEIASITAVTNTPSRRVMEKIGLKYDANDDFDHAKVDKASPLCRHVLYRLTQSEYFKNEEINN